MKNFTHVHVKSPSKAAKEWLAKYSISQQKVSSVFVDLNFSLIGLLTGIITAVMANSTTLYSEVLKNACLTVAIFLSWFSLRKVRLGDTESYNFGYGKLENIASLVVSIVMIVSFFIIISYTFDRFIHPVEMRIVGLEVAVIFSVISLILSLGQWKNDHRLAKKEPSPIMDSLWRLHRVRAISTGVVALSLFLSMVYYGEEWSFYIDPIGSSIIALFLLYSIYNIGFRSMYDLLDHSLEDSLKYIILHSLATYFDQYKAMHGIRSRRSGGNVYIEIFLEFEDERKMLEVYQIITSIKRDVEQRIKDSNVVIMPTKPLST